MILNGFYFNDGTEGVVVEELPQPVHVLDPGMVGEQTIVTDAVEATRQDMQQKAPDELVGGQGHGLVTITLTGTIVFPLEGDLAGISQPAACSAIHKVS